MASSDVIVRAAADQHKSDRGLLVGGSLTEQLDEARKRKPKRALFGPFWSEREIAFLYGGTGVGKSVLAMQIATGIAQGKSAGWACEVHAQPVLLLDFENDAEDLLLRIGNEDVKNIYRFNLDPDRNWRELIADVCMSIVSWASHYRSHVVIIDNITWLLDSDDKRRDVSVAADLMKKLKAIKDEMNLAILVIGHTPKSKFNEPLTTAHLFGSSMLGNYANSMFAVGANRAKGMLYLIQTKRRGGPVQYGSDGVAVCRMDRNTNGMLVLAPDGIMRESDILNNEEDGEQPVPKRERILKLMDEGLSNKQIECDEFKPDYVKKMRREWKVKQVKIEKVQCTRIP